MIELHTVMEVPAIHPLEFTGTTQGNRCPGGQYGRICPHLDGTGYEAASGLRRADAVNGWAQRRNLPLTTCYRGAMSSTPRTISTGDDVAIRMAISPRCPAQSRRRHQRLMCEACMSRPADRTDNP